jgi:hypothetical protein
MEKTEFKCKNCGEHPGSSYFFVCEEHKMILCGQCAFKTAWHNCSCGAWQQGDGMQDLWFWFGCSRASFVTMPRAFMHEMPDAWQKKMAQLLTEWDDAWNWGDMSIDSTVVTLKKDGKFVKTPELLINYRHPDREKIKSMFIDRKND